jgi:hypothetical protein
VLSSSFVQRVDEIVETAAHVLHLPAIAGAPDRGRFHLDP